MHPPADWEAHSFTCSSCAHCPSAGQEAPPTKVTTPLMQFLTEKHTPKAPKRTPNKKVSTGKARQGRV